MAPASTATTSVGSPRHRDLGAGEPGDAGVAVQKLRVRHPFRATDIVRARFALHRQRTRERLDDVDDRDRLDAAVHPRRHRVHRHPLADLADHLEARRPGPRDDRGAQGEHADAGRRTGEDALDLQARGDVFGQLVLGNVRNQAAEVDEQLDPRCGDGPGHVLRRDPVGRGEVLTLEGVDQVVDGVHPLDGRLDGGGVQDVHPHELDVVGPPGRAGPLEVRHGRPHVVAVAQEARDEATADVAGGSGDQNPAGLGGRGRGVRGRGVRGPCGSRPRSPV
jgi:hypothetical protein